MKTFHKAIILFVSLAFSSAAFGQNKTDANNLIKQGIALHDDGKHEEAIKKYQEAIKIDPENPLAYYELSYTLFTSGKGKEAISYLEKVLKLDPGAGGAYDMLGSIYDDDKQPEKALDYYTRGIKADPTYQRLHYNIAITYYREGKYAEAEASAENAVRLDRKHASSQRIYALAANTQNKPGRSLLAWCSFLLMEPQTKRSPEALAYVKAIINNGITKAGGKTNISVSSGNLAGMMMPLAVSNATSGKSNLSGIDSLTLQLTSLFKIAHTITFDKDSPFVKDNFSNFFESLGQSGNMPAFVRYISLSAYNDENLAWFKDHDKELKDLEAWLVASKRAF